MHILIALLVWRTKTPRTQVSQHSWADEIDILLRVVFMLHCEVIGRGLRSHVTSLDFWHKQKHPLNWYTCLIKKAPNMLLRVMFIVPQQLQADSMLHTLQRGANAFCRLQQIPHPSFLPTFILKIQATPRHHAHCQLQTISRSCVLYLCAVGHELQVLSILNVPTQNINMRIVQFWDQRTEGRLSLVLHSHARFIYFKLERRRMPMNFIHILLTDSVKTQLEVSTKF